jgi:hypothetical protein
MVSEAKLTRMDATVRAFLAKAAAQRRKPCRNALHEIGVAAECGVQYAGHKIGATAEYGVQHAGAIARSPGVPAARQPDGLHPRAQLFPAGGSANPSCAAGQPCVPANSDRGGRSSRAAETFFWRGIAEEDWAKRGTLRRISR